MAATPLRLLMLEDDPSDAELVLHALRRAGYAPTADRVETEADFRDRLRDSPEVILADFSMPEFDAPRALEILQECRLDIPFIIVSGVIGEERAVRAMQRGASDYIIKDRLERLGQAVAHALDGKAKRDEARLAERRLGAQHATTKVLAESASLDSAVPKIFEAVCASMGWDWAAAWMAAPDGGRLALAAHWHTPTTDAGGFLAACREKTFASGEGLPGRVWATGEPLWVEDVLRDEHFFGKRSATAAGLHTAFAFPVLLGREVVGVIEFLSRRAERPDEKVLGMMAAVGSQIGQFIERKRVEEGFRLFRALIDRTTDGVEVIDPETGRYLDVNETACAAHGYTRDEFLGLGVPDIDTHPSARPWAEWIAERRLAGTRTFESRHRRKDGSSFPVEVNLTFIRLDRDYLVSVVRDITERKSLEELFHQSQKMEAFGQLAGGVAHDFNNLLTIISGYSGMLLDALGRDDRNRGLVEEIHTAGARAARLTAQLLAFSRRQVVRPRVLDLNGVVAGTEAMLGRLIGEDVTLATVPAADLDRVKADPGQLEQVILNLVVNARDAMPTGGRITVATANVDLEAAYARNRHGVVPGRHVRLAVSDTGCGMTDAVVARIFEPYFTTKEVGKGTGLGLASVFGIVQQSGGHVEVTTAVGRGTTFNVYFPAVADAAEAARPAESPGPVPSGTETVLIVEDEAAVRAMTRVALQASGYTLLEAADGADALGVCERHAGPIHLLLSDVVMPRMGGRQLAERLTARHPRMRVLFVSGYTDDAVVRHGVRQAEVAFLQKPFTADAVRRKVRAVLDGTD